MPEVRDPPTKLRAVPERFAIAQVTPHPWEDEHEVNAFAGELARELAERGHRLLVLAPSRSPQLVRESRKLIRSAREKPEALFDPDGGVRVLGVGELLPLQRRARGGAVAAGRHRADDRGGAGARAARLRARPRAVRAERVVGRAAALPGAQRRLLPRAHRAGAVDPGGAPLRRAVLRPPRRPHRLVRRDARSDGALLPGELPAAQARAPRSVERPPTRARCGSRSARRRSARRCGCSCARCGGCRRSSTGGDGVLADRRGAHRRAAQPAARPADAAVGRRHHRERGARQRRRRRSPRASDRRPPPGCSFARSAPGPCRSPPACPPTRKWSATASWAAVRARRRRRARGPARAGRTRACAASSRLREPPSRPRLEPRRRRGGGHLHRAGRSAPAGRTAQAPRCASGSPGAR